MDAIKAVEAKMILFYDKIAQTLDYHKKISTNPYSEPYYWISLNKSNWIETLIHVFEKTFPIPPAVLLRFCKIYFVDNRKFDGNPFLMIYPDRWTYENYKDFPRIQTDVELFDKTYK